MFVLDIKGVVTRVRKCWTAFSERGMNRDESQHSRVRTLQTFCCRVITRSCSLCEELSFSCRGDGGGSSSSSRGLGIIETQANVV